MKTNSELITISRNIRSKVLDSLFYGGSGHAGSSMSIVEILTVLFFDKMNIKDRNNKDRLILSKGHAVPALYAALSEYGLIEEEELKTLRQIGSRLQGHPDRRMLEFLDAGTGALGQGLSIAIGYSLANKLLKRDREVYCILGDGELQEGQIWEAAMYASVNVGSELICIIDHNKLQNETWVKDTLDLGNIEKKWESFGWNVSIIDGHDIKQIKDSFSANKKTNKPHAIIAKTVKGKGISFMENNNEWHGKVLDLEFYEQAKKELKYL